MISAIFEFFSIPYVSKHVSLRDLNLAARLLLELGDHNLQDAVLQTGLDAVDIDLAGDAKKIRKWRKS